MGNKLIFNLFQSEGQDCSKSYVAHGDTIEDSKYENYYTPTEEWKTHTV